MIKVLTTFLSSLCIGIALGQNLQKEFPESFEVWVTNPLNAPQENAMILIPVPSNSGFNEKGFVVMDRSTEVPSQFSSGDDAGIVVVLGSMAAKEKRSLAVRYKKSGVPLRNYPKRTQAELSHKVGGSWKDREYIGGEFKNVDYLRVPPEHKDHSWFIRYEGPGWESDKVGYRFYLDQRNATDAFGKVTPDVSLQLTGLDGFDSYHNMQPWGMDILKVGKSLGVGTIGSLVNGAAVRVEKTDSVDCRITENGPVYSSVLTNYFGWKVGERKYKLQSYLSIHAGSRLTHERISMNESPENICTGLVKDVKAKLFTSDGDKDHFGYIATYGTQSLNSDDLGIAVLFKSTDRIAFTEDKESQIVTLKPSQNRVEYYFLAAWSKEPNGIKDQNQFLKYLGATAAELANPVRVEVTKK